MAEVKYLAVIAGAILTAFFVFVSTAADAQEVSGFVQDAVMVRPEGQQTGASIQAPWLLDELRVRLNFLNRPEAGPEITVRNDFVYDSANRQISDDLREAYLDLKLGSNAGMRIGRQVITWGVGDLIFVNDVFPKDYDAFYSGKPLEYLKLGSDAALLDVSLGAANLSLVAVPLFRPDQLPRPTAFSLMNPFPGLTEEVRTPEGGEYGVKLSFPAGTYDMALYFYNGAFHGPALIPQGPALLEEFPGLNVYGLSLQGPGPGDSVLTGEIAFYDSRDDRAGRNPFVENSSFRFLTGYQKELEEDFSLGVQFYGEIMENYEAYRSTLPPGLPANARYRSLVTLHLTRLFNHQTTRLSLFAFASPGQGDFLITPEAQINLSDTLQTAFGINLFGGSKATPFGSMNDNSNLFGWFRLYF